MKNILLLLLILLFAQIFPLSELYSMEPADSTEADKLYKKADDYWRDFQYDSSNFYYEKAASLYKQEKSWKNFIDCQKNIGINYRYLGNYAQAFNHLNNGLDAVSYLKENQDSLRAELYNSIGTIYYEKGNYDKAYKYYKDMLDLNEKTFGEEHVNTGKGYQNVGLIYYKKGDYEKAIKYLKKALSIWDSTLTDDNPLFANCYTNISRVYFLKNNYKKSIEYDEKAIKIWIDKLGEGHPYIALSYNNLANTYSYAGDYDKALEYNYKAMQIRRDFAGEESRDVAYSYAGIGNVFIEMGNLSNAAYFLNKAVSIYRKIDPTNPGLAKAYIFTGDLYRNKKDFPAAEAYYDSALKIIRPGYNTAVSDPDNSEEIPADEVLLTALTGKGNAYLDDAENTGEAQTFQKALDAFNLASGAIEKLDEVINSEESRVMLNKSAYEVNQKGISAALKLYSIKNDPDYVESAFRFSERNKARILSGSINKSDVRQFAGLPDSLLMEEKDLRSDLALYQTKQKEAGETNNLKAIGDNRSLLFKTQRKYDTLMTYLQQNFPAYHKLKYPDELSSSNEIRNILPSEAAVLEYFKGDSSITIFVLTKSSMNAVTVKYDSGFFDLVRSFRKSLPTKNYLEYLSSASELYSKLIKPVKTFLQDKTKLYIIPDYILAYLPFEALLSTPQSRRFNGDFSNLPYLMNDYDISYSYSGLLLKQNLQHKDNNQAISFAGFAPLFPDLPETGTEVKSIGDLFNDYDYHYDIYLNETSTESVLKSDKIYGYKFIQFATHGVIDDGHPGLSGLVFNKAESDSGNDSLLYVGDVYNLKLNADLLVLSGCESAPGEVVNGEGIYALTRSFLYAGTRNIVVSLWRAPDKSTSVLMNLFYKNILDRMDYSSALRKAKLELIKGGVYSYPLEWSPFILIGN